jgi:uncharacterized membrane protein YkvA (DUF1232 family)
MWPLRFWRVFKSAGRDGLVLLYALRDPDTPVPIKGAILGLALYTLSPIDLLPDLLMLFGWADDLALLMIMIPFLVRRLPPAVRARATMRAEQALGRFGAGRV